jgi:hypothetical protein
LQATLDTSSHKKKDPPPQQLAAHFDSIGTGYGLQVAEASVHDVEDTYANFGPSGAASFKPPRKKTTDEVHRWTVYQKVFSKEAAVL